MRAKGRRRAPGHSDRGRLQASRHSHAVSKTAARRAFSAARKPCPSVTPSDGYGEADFDRGTDHASSAEATHNDWPPAEFGAVALFDGRVKGVHVDVQDVKRGLGHRNDPAKIEGRRQDGTEG